MILHPARRIGWLLTLSFSMLWSWNSYAQAQENQSGSSVAGEQETLAPETPSAVVAESPTPFGTRPLENGAPPAAPDIYLLPDQTGKLRKVLGFRYEDFLEAWQSTKNSAAAAPPRFVFEKLEIAGGIDGTHAQLRIEMEVLIKSKGWTDIPIQLPGFIVQRVAIEDQHDGECLVFDKERNGHVVWLSAQGSQRRRIALEGLAKINRKPASHGVNLFVPRATTSTFTLNLPAGATNFESSPELVLSAAPLEAGVVKVKLQGQASPLTLNWMPAEENNSNQGLTIEAEEQTTVSIDPRNVLYRSRLQINSFGKPIKQIRVRLPKGTKFNANEVSSDYLFKELEHSSAAEQSSVVEIRSRRQTSEPWNLSLSAEKSLEPTSESSRYRVEGFEVLDAFRQQGTVTLEADDQLQAYFETQDDVYQIPLSKTIAATEGRRLLGQFRYSRYPWQIVVRTSPRQRRVSVQPTYRLDLRAEEALLDVTYDYQLTGAQIFSLQLDLQGWQRTDAPIETGGLIDVNGIADTDRDELILPLINPEAQKLRVSLSLRRASQLGENTFFLPEPQAAFVADGNLVVRSEEVLQVIPNLSEMSGLSVLSNGNELTSDTDTTVGGWEGEQLRLRTLQSRPKFVAEIQQRQLQISATEQTNIALGQELIKVQQQIDYQVRYGSVSQLSLNLPDSVWSNDSLKITLDGQAIPFGLASSDDVPVESSDLSQTSNEDAALRQVVVSLPRPMQNSIRLDLAYEIATPTLTPNQVATVNLPLASPQDLVSKHDASVEAPESIGVALNQRTSADSWNIVSSDTANDELPPDLRLVSLENPSLLPLQAQLKSSDQQPLANLERAWFQSWLTTGQRQERAAFRFRTQYDRVAVSLPVQLEEDEIEVLLDNEPAAFDLLKDQRLEVRLRSAEREVSHTLELRYQREFILPSWNAVRNRFPALECRFASVPVYWQLILPRGWLAMGSPEQMTPDYWLGWKNYHWGRQPALTQPDLEQFAGAISSRKPPALSSQYVYQALQLSDNTEIVVVRQSWLLLVCALFAFGIGLLWIYTALFRNMFFWLILSVGLLLGVFSYPEVTLFVVQVILAGGMLTFVTVVLRHVFSDVGNSPSRYLGSPTEVTESWRQPQPGVNVQNSESTVSLKTSGSVP